jgi:hypothetical protein
VVFKGAKTSSTKRRSNDKHQYRPANFAKVSTRALLSTSGEILQLTSYMMVALNPGDKQLH